MNIIPQVKCRRCGESFSSLRSTCPNCGTRRTAQSTRTPGTTPGTVSGTPAYNRAASNTKWQLIFGLILIVAVVLAVIVMVSTSLNGSDNAGNRVKATPTPPPIVEATPQVESAPTPPPTPTPTVQSMQIRYVTTDYTNQEFTMKLSIDEKITLNAVAYPLDVVTDLSNIHFSTDHPEILEVTDNGDGTCELHIIDTIGGGVVVTAECFGVTASVRVYCVNG